MPKIKLSHVVSCSSEDPVNNAENLLNGDAKKRFLCKNKGEASVSIILQFEKSCRICGIDVANANAAFVEVFAGRSSSKDQHFEIILPMSSFMTPTDSMNMTNKNRVRLFAGDDLASPAKLEKWDRVKIICTQPFNKNVQYGLTFVAFSAKDEEIPDLGRFHVRPASPESLKAGGLFAKRKEFGEIEKTPKMSLTQEIRTSTTPKCKKIDLKVTPGSSGKIEVSAGELKKQMDRNNRKDLFYDSDDEKNAGKVDRVVEQVKKQQEINDRNKQKTRETSERKKQMARGATSVGKNGGAGSAKRASTSGNSVKKRVKMASRPFNELLSDVVFTISGFVNPERGNIRQSGLNMGAKYRKDWDGSCTHLICAFANTPKFQQVRGKGKIIKKEWFYDCNAERKRLPWRRYALDKNDANKPESEDEICELTPDEPEERPNNLSGSDTDEEIQKIIKQQENEKKDECFDVETDEEHLEKNSKDCSVIPKLFKTEIFYIDDVFSETETDKLERLIKSFNGVVVKRISAIVDFVVTDEESVENVQNRVSGAKFVKKEWIFECQDQMVLVPYDKFVLK